MDAHMPPPIDWSLACARADRKAVWGEHANIDAHVQKWHHTVTRLQCRAGIDHGRGPERTTRRQHYGLNRPPNTCAFRAVCGPVHRAAALHSPARLVGAVRRDLDTTAPSTATARSNILEAMAYVLLHTGWRSRARRHHRRRPAARGRLNAVFLPSWTAGLPVCLVESSSELTLP